MKVVLSAADVQRIRTAAEGAYPEECCGLLIGRDGPGVDTLTITEACPSANLSGGDRRRGFEVDPALRFALMRRTEAAGDGTRIVGHYHSHPDYPARPSETDLRMAYEPDFVWLICAVADGSATDIGAFKLDAAGRAFEGLTLIIA